MPDPQTDDAQLAEDNAGILAAAVALCWHARPVLTDPIEDFMQTPQEWWGMQTEMERRLHIGRARVACSAWEAYWTEHEAFSEMCIKCGVNHRDPPSKLCPGCEAYQEHNAMSTPQWFAEFERQEAMREERLDEIRARVAEWRKGTAPMARVFVTDPEWFYQIEQEEPVGPFLGQMEAGHACRAELIRRAGG